jgi:hypothetical protein
MQRRFKNDAGDSAAINIFGDRVGHVNLWRYWTVYGPTPGIFSPLGGRGCQKQMNEGV